MQNEDISIVKDGVKFNFRVALLIKNKNKVLLESTKDFWNMPGGRVKFGESTLQSIKRETIEEFGINIENIRLLHIAENFFSWMGNNQQELLFVYVANLNDNHELVSKNNFKSKDSDRKTFKWFNINLIRNKEIKCLPQVIYELVDQDISVINSSIDKTD